MTLERVVCLLSVLSNAVAQGGWWQVASSGPAGRVDHAMAYDSQRSRTVLFGGYAPGGVVGDTWTWDGVAWTQTASAVPARRFHAMAHDSQRGRTVLFGGVSSSYFGDTWEWDGSTWTQVAATGPPPRERHSMAYDSRRGRTVLFGGGYVQYPTWVDCRDTWEWDGIAWTRAATSGPAASEGAMAYDELRGRAVFLGATGGTWEWDGVTWQQATTTGPSYRHSFAMAYDDRRARTVVFGGIGSTFLGDTWEWDGTDWTEVAVAGPPARGNHALAYDSSRGRIVLFGGAALFPVVFFGETWERSPPAAAVAYGNGCGRPPLALSVVASAPPVVGSIAQAALAGIPSRAAFVAMGWSNATMGFVRLPMSLAPFGMPGCELLQSADALALPVTPVGPGAATFDFALPNWSALIGMHLYLQAWALAPGVNPGGAIVSNGIDWRIGS